MDDCTLARFLAKIEINETGCWMWTASTVRGGYGKFNLDGRTYSAHRASFEHFSGVSPEGDLDHTCHNPESCSGGPPCPHRRCVNPDHLEPVSHRVNVLRGGGPAGRARQTECAQGHPLDGENLYLKGIYRVCKTCRRKSDRRRRQRERVERALNPANLALV